MRFDEPTASLDREMVGEVLTVICDLVREEGMTPLISIHERGFAREVAERVVVCDSREIIGSGPPERLFTNPKNERTRMFLNKLLKPA